MNKVTPLSTLGMLEAAIAESLDRPVLIFKHSRMCGISCEAFDELRSHVERCAADVTYAMITVQSHRNVSDSVTKTLGVRHETPQAILLKDGRPVWSASHFRVTAAELARALAEQNPRSAGAHVPPTLCPPALHAEPATS